MNLEQLKEHSAQHARIYCEFRVILEEAFHLLQEHDSLCLGCDVGIFHEEADFDSWGMADDYFWLKGEVPDDYRLGCLVESGHNVEHEISFENALDYSAWRKSMKQSIEDKGKLLLEERELKKEAKKEKEKEKRRDDYEALKEEFGK